MEQTNQPESPSTTPRAICSRLGRFLGFNFRTQSAIDGPLTADEVVRWEYEGPGGAEFRPAGDHPEVELLFKYRTAVTAADLLALAELLSRLGGDTTENFLRIHHAVNRCGYDLQTVEVESIEAEDLEIFQGTNFHDLRQEAACALFRHYFPEAYTAWQRCCGYGLTFDTDVFLYSFGFSVEEVRIGACAALLVAR